MLPVLSLIAFLAIGQDLRIGLTVGANQTCTWVKFEQTMISSQVVLLQLAQNLNTCQSTCLSVGCVSIDVDIYNNCYMRFQNTDKTNITVSTHYDYVCDDCSGPFQLTITADDQKAVYVNGQKIQNLPHAKTWNIPDVIPLDCVKVIAVAATNIVGPGALTATTPDGWLVTNSTWKCTKSPATGWEQIDYDDSSWPAAVEIDYHKKPNFIWAADAIRNGAGDLGTIYCRKRLFQQCKTRKAFKNCDNDACNDNNPLLVAISDSDQKVVYVNGQVVPFRTRYTLPGYSNGLVGVIPLDCVKVIAIHATSPKGDGYILAFTLDSWLATNSTWKCTKSPTTGWEQLDYDDSSWPTARANIVDYAQGYIWAADDLEYGKGKEVSAYCRKRLV